MALCRKLAGRVSAFGVKEKGSIHDKVEPFDYF
jgi:hypothetical protein